MSGRATSWLGDNDADNPSTTRSPSTCSLTPTETDQNEPIAGGCGGGVIEATPYACQFCDKAFPRLSYLKRHEQGHGDLMPFKCDFCHRLFKHKRSRDRHVKLHTGDKKYRCSHCDSAFSRSDHLKIHMKTHDTAKPFQCTVCNRGYNTAAALTSHMQNHKKANSIAKCSFRCLQCTASFLTSVQLKDHLMTHSSDSSSPTTTVTAETSDRPVVVQQCPICVKDFTSLDTLYEHMKTHTDVAVVVGSGGGGDVDQLSSACSQEATVATSGSTLHCVYCTKDGFQTLELLQLHVQTMHSSSSSSMLTNGDRSPSNPHQKAIGRSVRHRRSTPSPAPPQSSLPVPSNSSKSHHHHHQQQQQQLSCEYCTMKFNSIQALQKHTLSVHSFNDLMSPSGSSGGGHRSSRHTGSPGDDTVCQHCTMGFKSDAALTEHVKLVHGQDFASGAATSVNCDLQSSENVKCASPRTESSSSPKNGSSGGGGGVKVSNDQDFAHPGTLLCNQCDAAFPDFEAFRTHLKTHLDEIVEKHVCGECAGEFGSAEELECHAAGHFLATTTEYGCQSCLKLFSKPDELQKHLMDIHAHHLYRCSLCHKVFDSKVSVQVHFAVKHSNECKLYKCTGCSSVFRSELEFNVHVKVSHVRRAQPFRCLFCQFSYDSELELQCHLTTHKKQFKCRLCDDAFHVEFLLDRHVQNKHSSSSSSSSGGDAVARNSSSSSATAPALSSDVTVMTSAASVVAGKNKGRLTPTGGDATTPSTPITASTSPKKIKDSCRVRALCDGCDAEFASEISLNAHRRQTHHRTAAAACSSSTGSSSIGKQSSSTSTPTTTATTTTAVAASSVGHHHQQQQHHHHHVLSLHCAYCNESCKSRTELEQHVTRSHRNANCSGKHKCNICDELCPTATLLAEHKLTTHCKVTVGSMCVLCKANLKTEEQFYSHLQQHGSCGGGSGVDGSSPTSTNTDAKNNNGSGMLPVPCVVCRQTLMTEIDVQMHGKFHLRNVAEPLHPCCLCLKLYEPINLIENSIGGQSFICKECFHRGTASSSSSAAAAAAPSPGLISSASGNDRLRCPECRVKFETLAELESHLRTASCCSMMIIGAASASASLRKTYQCIKCQASFDSESEIQVHVATHVLHEGTCHECRLCARTFDSPAKLQCHLVEHTFEGARGGGYACYMCSAVFTTAALLQAHMLEHGLDSRPYDCSLCHQRFFFRAELENHAFSHGMADDGSGGDGGSSSASINNGTSKCPQCPELDFVTSTDMQRHYFDVHGDVTASTRRMSSDQSSDFRLRQRSKSGSCYECPSSGVGDDLNALSRHHLHSHHHQAVVKRCFQLHGTVSSSESIITPAVVVVKPYECPGCRRRFARNDNLRAHVQKSRCGGGLLSQRGTRTSSTSSSSAGGRQPRSGVGIMNSKAAAAAAASRRICGVCSVATVSTRALRRHMRDTHGRKYEFACPLCADPFSATDSLERHLKRSHGVNGVSDKKLCFENSRAANAVGVRNYERCPSTSDMSVNDNNDDDDDNRHRPSVIGNASPMEQDQECGSAAEDPTAADSVVVVKSELVTSG